MGVSFGNGESAVDQARRLYLAARSIEAMHALRGNSSEQALRLRAHCLLRLGDTSGAGATLVRLRDVATGGYERVEYHLLAASYLARCARPEECEREYAAAAAVAVELGGAAAADVAAHRAAHALSRNDAAAARRHIAAGSSIAERPEERYFKRHGTVRAEMLACRAALAAAEHDHHAQLETLMAAWTAAIAVPACDQDTMLLARIAGEVASLTIDVCVPYAGEFLWIAANDVSWTPETQYEYWRLQSALGWDAALRGDEVGAFARFRHAAETAPSGSLKIGSTLDRLFLALQLGQRIIFGEELLRIRELVAQYRSAVGDEPSLCLELAAAYAPVDARLAREWLDAHGGRPREALAMPAGGSERGDAKACDAAAAVLAAEGRLGSAADRRRRAVALWESLGCRWRAANSAMELSALTHVADDVRRATFAASRFPRSWIARRVRGIRRSKPKQLRAVAVSESRAFTSWGAARFAPSPR